MIVLGLDPGLANTGWGIVEKVGSSFKLIDCGVIKTEAVDEAPKRLLKIATEVEAIIKKFNPTCAGIEDLYFAKNRVSAFPVAEARGVLLVTLCRFGVEVKQLTPIQIKQSLTGAGRADKVAVQEMVSLILGKGKIKVVSHATDALAAAIAAVQFLSFEKKVLNVQ